MAIQINLRKLLHRKAWESCTSSPVVTAQGSFIVSDKFDLINGSRAFLVANASSIYMYEGLEDGWSQLPNSGITGTFAAGSCGEFRGLSAMGGSITQAATAGSTTTLTTSRTIVRSLQGSRVRVVAGSGLGYEGEVLNNTMGANAVLTVTPASSVAFDATTQFQVYSGSLWFFNAGTTAVGFSVYDLATNAWTARSVTGLPTAWGTDAQLISTMGSAAVFASGTATAGAATTITNSAKAWGTNMWANYQVRITEGTGKGQIRVISSNTGTVLTVSASWAVTPDATSVYSIEGNDDQFFLLGNASANVYKYLASTNTWSTLSPTAARGAASNGVTASWIDSVELWNNETLVPSYSTTLYRQNGRYIYSFRGGATSTLDVYDIAANTWVSDINYGGKQETFSTGSSAKDIDGKIYITKETTGRLFQFDVGRNRIVGLGTCTMQSALGGTAVAGDKLFFLPFNEDATKLVYLYQLRHSGADLARMLLV
jgi:hypothetical protein